MDTITKIIKKYIDVDNNITSTKIAKLTGISVNSIRNRRKKYGWSNGHYTPFKKNNKSIIITDKYQEIIVGSLLGDGCITKYNLGNIPRYRCNSCFSFGHSMKQEPYLDYKIKLIKEEGIKVNKYQNKTIKNRYTKGFCEKVEAKVEKNPIYNSIRDKWYIKGIKQIPKDITLSPLALAIWFMDDGCITGVISTNAFTREDCNFLRMLLLKQFNINTTLHSNNVIYIRRNSIKLFNSIIYPHITESMLYKIGSH